MIMKMIKNSINSMSIELLKQKEQSEKEELEVIEIKDDNTITAINHTNISENKNQ